MRSRSLVGWHISLSPNQTTIMFAFKQGVKSYGPPDSVKIDNALDLQKFSKLFERYAKTYNSSSHSGAGMNGRSPEQVLATRTSRRVILDEVLDLLLQGWSREIIVRKNGVQFKGLYYGQFNTDLLACQSKAVRLAYDPHDLRRVCVYDAATRRLITIAEQNQLINYGSAVSDEQLRESMRHKARALKVYRGYRDSALVANMDLADLVIRAMQEAKVANEAERTQQTLRPVRTPLDGQVATHKQLKARTTLAARPKEERLDLDLSALKPQKEILPVLEFDWKKIRGAKSA